MDIPRHRRTLKLKRTTSNTGEYEKEYTCSWTTIFMISISTIQLILHYINYSNIEDLTNFDESGPVVDALKYHPYLRKEIYRYVTYALVHK